MKALEEKIVREGKVYPGGILNIGSFLNQRIDVPFMMEMGREIARLYEGQGVNKVLTVEASGIALAMAAALPLGASLVFAKKSQSANMNPNVYSAQVYSYTHKREYRIVVSRDFLVSGDRVLLVDDFLANGEALRGLAALCQLAGAEVIGCAVAVEKGFQHGGDALRQQGIRVESLAIIDEMQDDGVTFRAPSAV